MIRRAVASVVMVSSLVAVGPVASAQNLVAFFSVSGGDRQIGTIDPSDGSLTLFGTPINGASLSTSGGTAYSPATDELLFVANVSGQTLYTAVLPTPTISTDVLSATGVLGLELDDGVPVALFSVSGDRQIGAISTATGAVTLLGSPINGANLSSGGNTAVDPAGNRLFFVGSPSPSGTNTVYSVDTTTGAATGAAVTPDTSVAMLVYDRTAGVLRALFNISGGRRLGTLDPATGAVVLAPSQINGGASIATGSDTIALDEAAGVLYFVGTPDGGVESVFSVDTVDGSATAQVLPAGTAVVSLELDPGAVPVELATVRVD